MESGNSIGDKKPTIFILQAGRGLAAMGVVIHHAALSTIDFRGEFAGQGLPVLGYLGVDFFFVLSGFIITHMLLGSSKSWKSFAAGRIKRVYLPYLPVGIGMALIYTFLPALSGGSHGWGWLPTLTLLPVDSNSALSVAWTLKHEMLFYAIFGLGWFSGRPWLIMGIWLAAIIAAYPLGYSSHLPLALINLEFFMGVAVALAYRANLQPKGLWLIALLAAGVWFMSGAHREWSVLIGLSFACMLLPLVNMERFNRLKVPDPLVYLGAASYSLYLVHNPLISVGARFAPLTGWANVALLAVFGTIGGIAYYVLIERNWMHQAQEVAPNRALHTPIENSLK